MKRVRSQSTGSGEGLGGEIRLYNFKGVVRDGRNKKVASERRLEGDEEAKKCSCLD